MFEKGALRNVFGLNREEVTGHWRELRNEELRDLYVSVNLGVSKLKRMRCVEHVTRVGEKGNACRVLMEKPEGNRPLGRTRRRWEGNIRNPSRPALGPTQSPAQGVSNPFPGGKAAGVASTTHPHPVPRLDGQFPACRRLTAFIILVKSCGGKAACLLFSILLSVAKA